MSPKPLTAHDIQSMGGRSRAKSLTARRRAQIAQKAAQTRWANPRARIHTLQDKPKPYDYEALIEPTVAELYHALTVLTERIAALETLAVSNPHVKWMPKDLLGFLIARKCVNNLMRQKKKTRAPSKGPPKKR